MLRTPPGSKNLTQEEKMRKRSFFIKLVLSTFILAVLSGCGYNNMQKNEEAVRGVTAKAWRFTGEMEEIAAIFREAGLPGEFHAAAGAIYRRLAGFKDAPSTPSLEGVLSALVQLPKDD